MEFIRSPTDLSSLYTWHLPHSRTPESPIASTMQTGPCRLFGYFLTPASPKRFPNTMTATDTISQALPTLRKGLVTVVMPNRNHGHFIASALEALCTQARLPDRLIVIDDQSTDNSRDVMARMQQRYPLIEIQLNPVAKKTIKNMNEWIVRCDTEYMYFAAADDLVLPPLLQRCIAALDANPQVAFATTASGDIAYDGSPLTSPPPPPSSSDGVLSPRQVENLLTRFGSFGSGNTTVYRTEFLRREGGFQEELRAFADGYLLQALALSAGCIYIPDVCGLWRHNADGNAGNLSRSVEQLQEVIGTIRQRMASRDAGIFSPAYASLFFRRWRYASSITFLKTNDVEAIRLLTALSGSECQFLKLILRTLGFPWASRFLYLRLLPDDTFRLLTRKIGLSSHKL